MSDIIAVMVMFKGEGSLNLYFEMTQQAHEAYDKLRKAQEECGVAEVRDNFGTRASVDGSEVRAIALQNMSEYTKVLVEVQMVNARASATLQKRQMADPALRFMGGGGMPNGQLIA
jgi:hypothetical protein